MRVNGKNTAVGIRAAISSNETPDASRITRGMVTGAKRIQGIIAVTIKTGSSFGHLFIDSINEIDKIVIGVEKIGQLQRNVKILTKSESFNKIKTLINFKDFFIKDLNVIDPRRW